MGYRGGPNGVLWQAHAEWRFAARLLGLAFGLATAAAGPWRLLVLVLGYTGLRWAEATAARASANPLTRRSMEPVRPVRRSPNPQASVLPEVRHRRHSPYRPGSP